METKVMTITPVMAKRILERNDPNRKVLNGRVNYYADQMKNGQWKLIGQGISFAKDGALIDGRHRLTAVIKSGVDIKFLIISGLNNDLFTIYDDGKSRNANDVLNSKGVKYSNLISSGILMYFYFKKSGYVRTGWSKVNMNITNNDVYNEYSKDETFYNTCAEIANNCYNQYRLYSPVQLFGLMAYVKKETEFTFEKVRDYLYELHGLKESKYIYIGNLRRFVIRKKLGTKTGTTFDKTHLLKMLVKGWNYYKKDKNFKYVSILDGEVINL